MANIKITLQINRKLARWRRGASRVVSFSMTIRGRILVAFLVMSMIAVALGSFATMGIRNAGALVDKTYDQSLMSINYARAAATDFAPHADMNRVQKIANGLSALARDYSTHIRVNYPAFRKKWNRIATLRNSQCLSKIGPRPQR